MNRASPSRLTITEHPAGWRYDTPDIVSIDADASLSPRLPAPHPGFVTQPSWIIRLSLRLSAWWDRTLTTLFTRR